ncbi:DNA-directed RNA polymerase subunit omega [bacterium]|nr:DNA-directed RNA polymerase subunit omega [bacterium]
MKLVGVDDLLKKSPNVYEAVMVISKRARQINFQRKQFLPQEEVDSNLLYEEEIDREALKKVFQDPPKPTATATEEFVNGKFEYKFKKNDE